MQNIPPEIVKEANSIFYNFLWNGPDKIKRSTMISNIEHGGLKMPHIESVIDTHKLVWIKRFSDDTYHPWKEFVKYSMSQLGGDNILNRKNPDKLIKSSKKISEFTK